MTSYVSGERAADKALIGRNSGMLGIPLEGAGDAHNMKSVDVAGALVRRSYINKSYFTHEIFCSKSLYSMATLAHIGPHWPTLAWDDVSTGADRRSGLLA